MRQPGARGGDQGSATAVRDLCLHHVLTVRVEGATERALDVVAGAVADAIRSFPRERP
ncbi:MAG: hypothetical protein KY458_10815 [Actinobacteria bacterium]|nr:hypothetical protein [Actinomycetota bacterium]